MHIQCTKKMLDHMKIKPAATSEENPLYSWHANLFNFNRRKTVVLMNDLTQYVIVLQGLKAKDFSNIHQKIASAIREVFLSEGISEKIIDRYLENAGEAAWMRTRDRGTVARLNKAVFNTEVMALGTETDAELSMYVSRTLVSRDGGDFFKPNEKLYEALQQWAGEKTFDTRAVEMKVTLKLQGYDVWRRMIVPLNRTFTQFHEILLAAFQRMDNHLHEFYIFDQNATGQEINWNDPAFTEEGYKPIANLVSHQEQVIGGRQNMIVQRETGVALSAYIPASKLMMYIYDFGDYWRHRIDVIRVIDHYDTNHPVCVDGAGAAPPDDVGGEGGYDAFLHVINNPEDPDHEHVKRWAAVQGYNRFDIDQINRLLKSS